jgi:hypothetical protein
MTRALLVQDGEGKRITVSNDTDGIKCHFPDNGTLRGKTIEMLPDNTFVRIWMPCERHLRTKAVIDAYQLDDGTIRQVDLPEEVAERLTKGSMAII